MKKVNSSGVMRRVMALLRVKFLIWQRSFLFINSFFCGGAFNLLHLGFAFCAVLSAVMRQTVRHGFKGGLGGIYPHNEDVKCLHFAFLAMVCRQHTQSRKGAGAVPGAISRIAAA